MEAAQERDHLLRQPVAQELLVRIARQVRERQDGQLDRRRPSLGLERFEAFGNGGEIFPELLNGLIAVGRFLGQGLSDDMLQIGSRAGTGF